MNAVKLSSLALVVVAVGASPTTLAQPPQAPQPPPAPAPSPRARPAPPPRAQPSAQTLLRDVQQQLGFVPQFMRQIPSALLPSFLQAMEFESSTTTALDPKTKELIGLAVAAQIPCDYCIYFHTQAARSLGASDQEIAEAVGMAGVTRQGSTMLNGLQIDARQFRRDVDRMMRDSRQQSARATPPRPRK